ncbi:UNVERIFIED_CONTAM: hypothetical protein GTU68_062340 [Idotea baltica]|nr:hypothetical protein [Idotea baltica]
MPGPVQTSSFQKKAKSQIISIPGTKPSVHNSQLLISTGIPSFDFILGGGLPVGSILLIEEDTFDIYSKLFMKFYLAEGLLNGHLLHLASLDEIPGQIIKELPAPSNEQKPGLQSDGSDETLKIAWRYQNKAIAEHTTPVYDITKVLDVEEFRDVISLWDGSSGDLGTMGKFSNPLYLSLLKNIDKTIQEHDLIPKGSKLKSNLLRLAIHSLVSPLWGEEYSQHEKDKKWTNITLFLTLLKSIVRSSFSVALITVPSHLISDPVLVSRLYGIVDFGVRLESFQGSAKETNPIFKEYHGLFHVNKLSALNTIVPNQLDSLDWAFQVKRKSIHIKRLHLPPELSETTSRAQEDTAQSCSGGVLPKHLDF